MARSRAKDAFGATISGYAAGFIPVPLAVTTWLLFRADNDHQTGSVSVLWVLIAAIPAALILGPLNLRRTLVAASDDLADATAKTSAAFGIVGVVMLSVLLVPFLYLGWIGLVLDIALTAVTVPGLARQRVLSKLEEAHLAERARLRGTGRRS
jgi:hypothetical protein